MKTNISLFVVVVGVNISGCYTIENLGEVFLLPLWLPIIMDEEFTVAVPHWIIERFTTASLAVA